MIFLCWGSFLNVLAYRIIHDVPLSKRRSFCTHCKITLKFLDLIPVLSWLSLKGRCRYCKKKISFLYPLIELLTAFSLTYLFINDYYAIGYFVLFSALLISVRTDLEKMLISRLFTLYLIPVAFLLSLFKFIPISIYQSILGAIIGFLVLFIINKIFYLLTKKEGIGEGDFDILALIGSFLGPAGVFYSLFLASISGSIIGIILILFNNKNLQTKLPFGPFLALGAIILVYFKSSFSILNLC